MGDAEIDIAASPYTSTSGETNGYGQSAPYQPPRPTSPRGAPPLHRPTVPFEAELDHLLAEETGPDVTANRKEVPSLPSPLGEDPYYGLRDARS